MAGTTGHARAVIMPSEFQGRDPRISRAIRGTERDLENQGQKQQNKSARLSVFYILPIEGLLLNWYPIFFKVEQKNPERFLIG